LGYRSDDIVYTPLPLAFDYGLYQLFLGALSGAHVWLGSPAEAGPLLLYHLRESAATVLPALPAIAEPLVWLLERQTGTLPKLRLLTNTGAAMPASTLQALRGCVPTLRVQLMYGLTECKRATIMPPDEDLKRPGASGRALPGTRVWVADDVGNPLPPGETGEIIVQGPHVMSGYWGAPELTMQRFFHQPAQPTLSRLRTGDYGRLDEDGYLYVEGRRDDIYKQRGHRVGAGEVEAAAKRIAGVRLAAVVPPRTDTPADPAVLVVTGELTAEQVRTGLGDELEDYKIPRRIVVADTLPLTGTGKIDKVAVREHLAGLPRLHGGPQPARGQSAPTLRS
jgi:acyl-CoA synthetase (AMP-forming)/AMP-acid ligase II